MMKRRNKANLALEAMVTTVDKAPLPLLGQEDNEGACKALQERRGAMRYMTIYQYSTTTCSASDSAPGTEAGSGVGYRSGVLVASLVPVQRGVAETGLVLFFFFILA